MIVLNINYKLEVPDNITEQEFYRILAENNGYRDDVPEEVKISKVKFAKKLLSEQALVLFKPAYEIELEKAIKLQTKEILSTFKSAE